MMEEFKVIKAKEMHEDILYTYEFKLNEQLFYAQYSIYASENEIYMGRWYFFQPELKQRVNRFSDESMEKIKNNILDQKDIRLRNLLNPYKFIY